MYGKMNRALQQAGPSSAIRRFIVIDGKFVGLDPKRYVARGDAAVMDALIAKARTNEPKS